MSGTPTGPAAGSCGPTPGGSTLSGAGYTAVYAYDTLDRLTTGPAGSYTYGDSAHLHAVTATSNGHGYAYDAAGNATCRTTNSSTPCSGSSPSGAALSYDAAGRLAGWQNTPSSPTTTDAFLYDGSGERLEQQVTSGGTTTTTRYIGALAEYTLKSSTSWRKYYTFAGMLVADNDGVWNDVLSDQEGTAEAQVSASGAGEEGSLRKPYGATRYGTSEFMGDLGYTGQRKDSTPNLTYFHARYYDQDVGVFLSADTVAADGLNRYGYVAGNPETATDPTGHCPWCIGLIVGAIVGAGIAYGAQVYNNYQSGAANPWTTNINWGTVAAGAAAGALVGGTLGAGAGAAGAILAGGGTVTEAAGAGAYSAALFAGYGVGLSVGGGDAADELDEGIVSRTVLNDTSSNGSSATGTVWDRITPQGQVMPGTEIPGEFDLDTEMGRFRVTYNATKWIIR